MTEPAPAPEPEADSVPDSAPEDVPPPPEPLGVAVPATGDADVDAALGRLADADDMPVHAHIEVYEDVHRALRDTLGALDENRS